MQTPSDATPQSAPEMTPATGSGHVGATDGISRGISRRTIAKGAAWSVPTIAMGAMAPAYAASADVYGPTVCYLFYAKGESVNYQGLQVFLGVSSTTAIIPKGTDFAWTVTMQGGANNEVPTLSYSQNSRWSLSVSPVSGSPAPSFTVHLRVLASDVKRTELNCNPSLIWNNIYTITPSTTVTVEGKTTISSPGLGQGKTSALSFEVARRDASSGRKPHKYLSKSGLQTCYPEIKWVATSGSNLSVCGAGGNDTSTLYPDGSCAKVMATSPSQPVLPAKC